MLSDEGVVLIRAGIPVDCLRRAAEACLAMDASDSAAVASCPSEELTAPWRGLEPLIAEALGGAFACNLEQSWVRRKFSPSRAQGWHQDGGLWVKYPLQPGPMPAMTPLVTCWIPLDPCDASRPGLEFIRRPLEGLLHFTELDDALLRRRFPPEKFWAPATEPGDVLLFRPGVLHRTHFPPGMTKERLSVEYRFLRV